MGDGEEGGVWKSREKILWRRNPPMAATYPYSSDMTAKSFFQPNLMTYRTGSNINLCLWSPVYAAQYPHANPPRALWQRHTLAQRLRLTPAEERGGKCGPCGYKVWPRSFMWRHGGRWSRRRGRGLGGVEAADRKSGGMGGMGGGGGGGREEQEVAERRSYGSEIPLWR